MKTSGYIIILLLLCMSCAKPNLKTQEEKELDPRLIAKDIFSIVNKERQNQGLYKLIYDEKLADVALVHSKNMAKYGFLSHEDRERRSPQERINMYYPEVIYGESGENIGYSQGIYKEAVAKNLMQTWMNSPDLRANILSDQYSHIGAGIARDGSIYYGTLKFIAAVVKIHDRMIKEVEFGSEGTLKFEFAGNFDRDDLTVYCQFPDKSARYYTFNNQFYTGIAPLTPEWIDPKTFSVTLKFDKGKGVYNFQFGRGGNFFSRGYTVVAK